MTLRIVFAVAMTVLLTACQSSTLIRKDGFDVATQGIAVADAAEGALRSVSTIQRRDAELQLIDNAVNAHLEAAIAYTYGGLNAPLTQDVVGTRLAMLSDVRGAYEQLLALSDPALATEGSQAASGVIDALSAIEALPKVPPGAQKAITAAAAAVITYQQASDIKELNKAYLVLATSLRDLWKEEAAIWTRDYVDEVYRAHSKKVAQYKDNRFEPKDVGALVKSPYVPVVKYRLYRAQLITETHAEWKLASQKFIAVSRSLDKLVDAHTQLASSNVSQAHISQILRDIRSILEPLKGT